MEKVRRIQKNQKKTLVYTTNAGLFQLAPPYWCPSLKQQYSGYKIEEENRVDSTITAFTA